MSDRVTRFVGSWPVGEPANPQLVDQAITAALEHGGVVRACGSTMQAVRDISVDPGDVRNLGGGLPPAGYEVDDRVERGALEVVVRPGT